LGELAHTYPDGGVVSHSGALATTPPSLAFSGHAAFPTASFFLIA
jgi:hypothetical protein